MESLLSKENMRKECVTPMEVEVQYTDAESFSFATRYVVAMNNKTAALALKIKSVMTHDPLYSQRFLTVGEQAFTNADGGRFDKRIALNISLERY